MPVLWPGNGSSPRGVSDRRKLRRVTPDTPIQCLRMPVLTNNMGAVTNRDSSVTGRSQNAIGILPAEGVWLAPLLVFPK